MRKSRVMRIRIFAYAKTKAQISCAITAQLINAFVFVIWIIQSLYDCVYPGQKHRRPDFSRRGPKGLMIYGGFSKLNAVKYYEEII